MSRLKRQVLVAIGLFLVLVGIAVYRYNNPQPQSTPQVEAVLKLNALAQAMRQAQQDGDTVEADRLLREMDQVLDQHPDIRAAIEQINEQVRQTTPLIHQAREAGQAGRLEESIRLYEQAIDQLPEELDDSLKLELVKERAMVKNRLAEQP